MTLTLRAVSLNDQPLTQPLAARFDARGGTVGRADHNTLALPDPERHISREQAEIVAGASGFVIRNVGSSNPIQVRNQPLARGEATSLAHHDQVRIGPYLLEVVDESHERDADVGAVGDSPPPPRGAEATKAGAPPRPLPAMDNEGSHPGLPLSPGNPFADLLGPVTPGRPRAASPAPDTPWPARLPDDFDPFAAPPATPVAAATGARAAGAFDDLIPAAPASSLDDLFGLKDSAGGDPLAAFVADMKPAGSGDALPSTDPLVLFGMAAAPVPPPEVATDRTPELHAVYTPPRPVAARAPASEVPPIATRAPTSATDRPAATRAMDGPDAAALLQSFCEGAGVRVAAAEGASPELLRVAGMLLRAAIDGTLQLIAVRAATRHELHAQVTVIQARNNNPLKFSPDGQSALEQLLQPPVRGFLPGPAAVTEAMDDLVGHAIGTMAGTRAALEGVLVRFAPQALEDKLAGKSVIDSVLPMARKARLWELYLQHHEAIREEAQEDFHALFGRAFIAAYEQQLERLRQERPRNAP